MNGEVSQQEDGLPAIGAHLVLIRVMVCAHLQSVSRKRGECFLRQASELLASEEAVSMLLPIRPPAQRGAVTTARREAIVWWRQTLPTFMAALPDK